jgi:HKD family nuclease
LLASDGLERFRIAVAYARWDGIALVAKALEAFIDAGGEFQVIYGVANGVTTPDALLYSLYLQELFETHTYAGAIEDEYANSIFHPKFFEFRFDDRTIMLVGSANLTGAGLLRNTELVLELTVARGDSVEADTENMWRAFTVLADAITPAMIGSMKDDYDFSAGERGKFFRQDARLVPPVHLDPDVLDYLAELASARGVSLSSLVNALLRKHLK